jgi:hypothetical protein
LCYNNAAVAFCLLLWSYTATQCSKEGDNFVLKKKKMTAAATFFDGFAARKWQPPPFFCGFAMNKVTAAMSSPFSMVNVFIFFLCWCLLFSSLELIFNCKWWFFV